MPEFCKEQIIWMTNLSVKPDFAPSPPGDELMFNICGQTLWMNHIIPEEISQLQMHKCVWHHFPCHSPEVLVEMWHHQGGVGGVVTPLGIGGPLFVPTSAEQSCLTWNTLGKKKKQVCKYQFSFPNIEEDKMQAFVFQSLNVRIFVKLDDEFLTI